MTAPSDSADLPQDPKQVATAEFRHRYGAPPTVVARAPGRVNLIGEHTDYNDGFVMPLALPFATFIAAEPTTDATVTVHSVGWGDATFAVGDIPDEPRWVRYSAGMMHLLKETGMTSPGWRGVIASDIPGGASLSSSAALEMATGVLVAALTGNRFEPGPMALIGQRVENEIIGIASGIMDQLASASGCEGAASLIDCRSLTTTPAPLPSGTAIVVMDTGTRRELVDSEYDQRRASCEAAASWLGLAALRDATMAHVNRLPDDMALEQRRARHVVSENERTLAAADAMAADDAAALGTLMRASHVSLRDDYNVSGPALDAVVDIANEHPACFGARMTGGGFAGGTVALVDAARASAFCDAVRAQYDALNLADSGVASGFWVVAPAAGAGLVEAPH